MARGLVLDGLLTVRGWLLVRVVLVLSLVWLLLGLRWGHCNRLLELRLLVEADGILWLLSEWLLFGIHLLLLL